MNKALKSFIFILFEVLFLWTNILLITSENGFLLSNAIYLAFGIAGAVLLYFLNVRFGAPIERLLQGRSRLLLAGSLLLLLAWQLYAGFGGYFGTGWDPYTIRNTVFLELRGQYDRIASWYFSRYPNNILLVWGYTLIGRFEQLFGLISIEYPLVVFQCVLEVLALWVLYRVVYDLSGSRRMAWLAYGIAWIFVGVSPWFFIQYSDATGFILPILMIRIFQKANRAAECCRTLPVILWYILLGVLAIVGLLIKPQIVIAGIAVVLADVLCLFGKQFRKLFPRFILKFLCFVTGILVFTGIYNWLIIPSLHLQIDPEMAFGWQHYVKMGLNTQTAGSHSTDDVIVSYSIQEKTERDRADLEEAGRRLKEMGFSGLLKHLNRKQLKTYGDGTFSWAGEGNFFREERDWARNSISRFVRSMIRPEGENYQLFRSSKQAVWIPILFFLLLVILYQRKQTSIDIEKEMTAIVMAVIGLTLFELIFEARARYLFCYTPLFVILAALGMHNLHRLITAWHNRNRAATT